MECEHCKNTFKTLSSLNYHKTNAKYCLKSRNKSSTNFRCEFCSKNLSSKHWLESHINKCTSNIDAIKKHNKSLEDENKQLNIINNMLESQLIEQKVSYERTIKDLQDKLENIAIKAVQKSTTTVKNTQINNYIQKMQPITQEILMDHTPHLTIEHIKKGASGYAEYALEGPLKDRIACVDYSRRKIKFKDTEGNIITDPEMAKLAPMFFDSIKDKSSQLVYSLNTPDMDSAMFEGVAKLFNTNADVKNGATGIKSEFYHDFVKHVCSGSMVE
jgi:regulator of replication initiation timing